MPIDRFKLDLARAIGALLPYAREHPLAELAHLDELRRFKGVNPERVHDFPPHRLVLTIEDVQGVRCPMVSVSAPGRPVARLDAEERGAVSEVFREAFPGHRFLGWTASLIPASASVKFVAVPQDAPARIYELWERTASAMTAGRP